MHKRRKSFVFVEILFILAALMYAFALAIPSAFAQGGCGSVCIPLEALDPQKAQVSRGALRLIATTQYGNFNNFRVGDDEITNMGGNKAKIKETAFFLDYGYSDRVNLSLMIPYIDKTQETNMFGTRQAAGVGDIAAFWRYEVLKPSTRLTRRLSGAGPSVSVGVGLKFPNGNIDKPGGGQPTLPPAFQVGSGAYDLLPTISYYEDFRKYSLFGNAFMRIPLEENDKGYKFGNEYEIHFGIKYPVARWKRRLAFFVFAGLSLCRT